MTSGDNAGGMQRLELLLREHFSRTEKQISDMRAENAEFHATMIKEMGAFKSEVRQDISALRQDVDTIKSEVRQKFREVKAEISELQRDVTRLYHWDYWLLSIILVVFAMPQIVAGIKSLFGAVADGISLIARAFRGEDKPQK